MNPACPCHGEPQYWNKDRRTPTGGFWTCAVKQRARVNARYAADREKKLAQVSSYYHDRGGWAVRRRRNLNRARQSTIARLAELAQEAVTLEP